MNYQLESANHGELAAQMIKDAYAAEKPLALALVDMRMPPGWDGVKIIQHMWKHDPSIQGVICKAYSDYSCSELVDAL